MIDISMKTSAPLNKDTVQAISQERIRPALSAQTVGNLNMQTVSPSRVTTPAGSQTNYSQAQYQTSYPSAARSAPQRTPTPDYHAFMHTNTPEQTVTPAYSSHTQANTQAYGYGSPQRSAPPVRPTVPVAHPVPTLLHPIQKGQKAPLKPDGSISRIRACFGWTALNGECDVDVSAFLLNTSGKVIGESWFVFYGQTESPDGSTLFTKVNGTDLELISVDFSRLDPEVSRIVFVLTINEALEKHLNFSMLKDAYVRIIENSTNAELVSFKMSEYYSNVTSMMIGELYLHKGIWKFNAVGNGVARDLAGLCELYGVETN